MSSDLPEAQLKSLIDFEFAEELKVLEDMLLRKGVTKEVVAAAVRGAKEEISRQLIQREIEKAPPAHLTPDEQIIWCTSNGGHFDRGGVLLFTCARCPYIGEI